jgi:hypothetical protein
MKLSKLRFSHQSFVIHNSAEQYCPLTTFLTRRAKKGKVRCCSVRSTTTSGIPSCRMQHSDTRSWNVVSKPNTSTIFGRAPHLKRSGSTIDESYDSSHWTTHLLIKGNILALLQLVLNGQHHTGFY